MRTTSEFPIKKSLDASTPVGKPARGSLPPPTIPQTRLQQVLADLLASLERLPSEFDAEYRRVAALRERLDEDRFHLAVLGQFKRGKSTLLNALLGEALLPSSVVPLTSVATFVRLGEDRRVRIVHRPDGGVGEELTSDRVDELCAFLRRFVTEDGNPRNTKQVSYVEVFHPASILGAGVVLIDTPGIGSTFRHNTAATLNFLSECDAALFLASADPPLTEVELAFLKKVQARVGQVFFLLNKVDYLCEDDRRKALGFLREVLAEHAGVARETPVFATSALQGLKAKETADGDLWAKSGLADLEQHLLGFFREGKGRTFREAIARKALSVVADVLLQLRLAIRSITMPLADLEKRLHTFERKLQAIESQRVMADDLLAGERRRQTATVESETEPVRRKARRHLQAIAREHLAREPDSCDWRAVEAALADAVSDFFERQWGEISRRFSSDVAEALRAHRRRADVLTDAVRQTASGIFEIPQPESPRTADWEMTRLPHWASHGWSTALGAISLAWLDRFLPRRLQESRLRRHVRGQIEGLVVRNAENLRWAMLQNLDQTLRRFASDMDERFKATRSATLGAIEAAKTKRTERHDSVAKEIGQFEAAEKELQPISEELRKMISG